MKNPIDSKYNSKYIVIGLSFVLFLLTALVIRVIKEPLGQTIGLLVFPIYFFALTMFANFYWNFHKASLKNLSNNQEEKNLQKRLYKVFQTNQSPKTFWHVPTILMILYLITGYFFLFPYMSGLKIVSSLASGLLANLLFFILTKTATKIRKKKDKTKTLSNELEKKEQKEQNEENSSRSFTAKVASPKKFWIGLIIPLLATICLEIYYKMCTFGTPEIRIQPLSILILLAMIYTFYFLFLSILKTTYRANLCYMSVFLILFVANQMRIFYTSDTLLLTDFLFLETTGELVNFVDVTLINSINYVLFPTIIVFAIFLFLLSVNKKYNWQITKKKTRISIFLSSLSFVCLLFLPIKTLDQWILNRFYDATKVSDYVISVSNTRYYYRYGVLGGMYGKFLESRRYEPDNYEEEGLKYILNNAPKQQGTWKRPNIIVIFSESFWDLNNLDEIQFDQDIQKNFHELEKKGKLVQMISPSYGGISANVEFEILTGGSLNYFSKGYIPYMQLYNKHLSENTPSIIKELKKNGYKTTILNSSSRTMFNCDKVYDFYQVDRRTHLYDEIDLNGEYVSDEYLTDQIIEYFDEKPKDEKAFFFAITMGGHMPYYEERYDHYDFNIQKSPYNDEINGTIKSYAEGMRRADEQLGRLYDYIKTQEEDTMIVFFGDHLPHLQTKKGKDTLFEIGYLNNDYDLESIYRQFNTKALILSNYEINYDEAINYLSPDLLFPYILNNMDLELSPYYKWLYQTIKTLPSSNYVVTVDQKGNLYYTLGLEGKMKDTYELRKKVQYMMFQ